MLSASVALLALYPLTPDANEIPDARCERKRFRSLNEFDRPVKEDVRVGRSVQSLGRGESLNVPESKLADLHEGKNVER